MISEAFRENKWYINLLFAVMFLYFLYQLVQGLFPILNPPSQSPLIPHYANYFFAIRAIVVLARSIVGIFGIIYLYQNKKSGWVLTLSAALAFISLLGYYMISDMEFIFLYIEVPYLLVIVYLLWKDTRTKFEIKPVNYLFPVLFSIALIMLETGAFPLSLTIAALIE